MIEWQTALAGLVVVSLVAVADYSRILYGIPAGVSQLTLINGSAETIDEATLRQGDSELAFGAVATGHNRSTDFFSHQGPVTLVVKFNSGRTMSADSVGYLPAGIPVVVTFEVTDNEVALLTVVKRRTGRHR